MGNHFRIWQLAMLVSMMVLAQTAALSHSASHIPSNTETIVLGDLQDDTDGSQSLLHKHCEYCSVSTNLVAATNDWPGFLLEKSLASRPGFIPHIFSDTPRWRSPARGPPALS